MLQPLVSGIRILKEKVEYAWPHDTIIEPVESQRKMGFGVAQNVNSEDSVEFDT
jgi:hypothetical protein